MGLFTVAPVRANGLNALANSAGISNGTAAGTHNLTTYADVPSSGPSPSSVAFTKQHASSALSVRLELNLFSTLAATIVWLAVRINGVDYDIEKFVIPDANKHVAIGKTRRIPNLAAGAYTVQARWRRDASGAAGTLTVDTNTWIAINVLEVQ